MEWRIIHEYQPRKGRIISGAFLMSLRYMCDRVIGLEYLVNLVKGAWRGAVGEYGLRLSAGGGTMGLLLAPLNCNKKRSCSLIHSKSEAIW
jgi:hypothetical protein